MKKIIVLFTAVACALGAAFSVNAFDIKDLLGNGGSSVKDLVQGVFSSDDIEVADLAGEWTIDGSAVCFKSEDFLKKAGGAAAATALEGKINPYFAKAGLNGSVFTIQTDGTFTLVIKGKSINGTIEKGKDKNFVFKFKAFGKISLGGLTTYVSKTSKSMDVMFDADGLRKLVIAIAGFTGNSTLTGITSLLKQYDGLCVGFSTDKTGKVAGEKESVLDKIGSALSGGNSKKNETESEENKSTGNNAKNVLEELFNSQRNR